MVPSFFLGVLSFIGLVATLVCIGLPGWYWGFTSLIPGVIHLILMATHCAVGLGVESKRGVARAYHDLPRQMRKEFSIKREDIKAMSWGEAESLTEKMRQAREYHFKVDQSRINDANSYLDAYLDVRKELG